MKEYNYDEIRQMQEKALERVRDMQAKTHQLVNVNDEKTQEQKQYRDNFYNAVKNSSKADYIKMPVEIDEKITDYQSFENYFTKEAPKDEPEPQTQESQQTQQTELLETLIQEPDKALLLSLLLLLQADKADEELIMSLLYIML